VTEPPLFTKVATLDQLVDAHAAALGRDRDAYRNHTYRVLNLCMMWAGVDAGALERVAIATAFHDLGIWTDRTFDYLQPSVALAVAHLNTSCRHAWIPEVAEMILQHHRVRRYQSSVHPLVEPFRRADWVDVSGGILTFGVPRARLRRLYATWPSAGFHRRLAELGLRRLRTHPWNPLPMVRL